MPPLGPTELIIILVVVLVVFGAGKLPEVGGALGKGIKEFKKATSDLNEVKTELKQSVSLDPGTEADKTKPSA